MTDSTPPTFTATPDQATALSQIEDWLETRSSLYYLLKGYAGTGKTFCVTEVAKSGRFKPHQICFTAPTNKAVKVLRNYLDEAGLRDSPSRTIFSLLGLSLQANGEVKELTAREEPVDLSSLRLIVVDEASMVNSFLMEEIRAAAQNFSLPILFMGDPAQLPPVGEVTSPVWAITNSFELTKVMRYGNSMLDLATSIRKVVDSPFPAIKIVQSPPVYRPDASSFQMQMLAELEKFRDGSARVIAWRNVTVDKYNQFLRTALFGKEAAKFNQWLPGDKVVATAQLKDLDDNTFMRTDEEAEVEAIAIGQHPIYSEFEIFNLLVKHETERKYTLRTLTPSGQFHLNNRLNDLSMEAKSGKRYKWREFWQLKEAFHEIRHSYAITSHRSQGSSYDICFVDLQDIMLNRNRQEAFRSLYVACTRARKEIWVC